jgi:competence ComEA-like helix-hairpin-helix protein
VLAAGLVVLVVAVAVRHLSAAGSRAAPSEPVRYRIDVNAAAPASLELLSGIGPALAERIITHRREHGPYRGLGDLREVRGIGPKRSGKMAQHIRFGSAPAAREGEERNHDTSDPELPADPFDR